MLQTKQPKHHRSHRSQFRRKSRSRKDALPLASFLFLVSIALLAVFYSTKHSSSTPTIPNANSLLDVVTSRSGSGYRDLCTRDGNIFSKKTSLIFLIPGVIFAFVGLALVTDDYFVAALEQICERLDLTEDVAGATFMAAGSSTPEFFASMLGVFVTKDQVGIGTIVGSAVFNILVIVGLSAALAGAVLELDWRPLMRDSFFYVVSIGLLMLFTMVGGGEGTIKWWEGLILVFTYIVYVSFMAYFNKPYMNWAKTLSKSGAADTAESEADMADVEQGDLERDMDSNAINSIGETPKKQYRNLTPRMRLKAAQYAVIAANRFASSSSSNSEIFRDPSGAAGADSSPAAAENGEGGGGTIFGVEKPSGILGWVIFPCTFVWSTAFRWTIVDCSKQGREKWWWVTFLLSIVWISGISYVMVEAARISGCLIGIPSTAMGLTVLAAGTSVPDALASISVARDGAGDMAVSNAIGSNVFDILLGLGVPWFLGDLILEGEIKIETSRLSEVIIPIVILFGILILFVLTLVLVRWKLRPLLGYILFSIYAAFVTYTLIDVLVIKKD